MMKDGDFIKVDYVATIKESGLVFEVTNIDEAKKRGIFNPQNKYRSLPVIIGSNFVIKGLEEALKEMKVGDKKKVNIKPDDGFGERNEKLIKTFPESQFTKENIVPYQGMPVNIKNMMGIVQSVSGGRVKVDFNHPLAGKELIYEVEIKEKIIKTDGKVKSVLEFYFDTVNDDDVVLSGKTAEIKSHALRHANPNIKSMIVDIILKWIPDVEIIKFVDEYNRQKTENKKSPSSH